MRLFVLNFYWEQRKPHDRRDQADHAEPSMLISIP
jgi:hypothetical protein